MTTGYFIPRHREFALPAPDQYVCPEDHKGDSYTQLTTRAEAVEKWTCCDTETVIGEVFDCDTCLEPGITPTGHTMPDGWAEDTNGHHCPKCQAPA